MGYHCAREPQKLHITEFLRTGSSETPPAVSGVSAHPVRLETSFAIRHSGVIVAHAWGWGHLYLKLDIILVKKNHVIRVVFQDKAMYERTSFRGAKTYKIGKKGVFLAISTNFGKDMTDKLRKTHAKNTYLGYIFIPEKYVFKLCFENPFTRMISSLKYKCPPGAHGILKNSTSGVSARDPRKLR